MLELIDKRLFIHLIKLIDKGLMLEIHFAHDICLRDIFANVSSYLFTGADPGGGGDP